MKKTAKKAAKKRRPKIKTFTEFGIVDSRNGCICSPRFLDLDAARNHIEGWNNHYCATTIRITYEVRR